MMPLTVTDHQAPVPVRLHHISVDKPDSVQPYTLMLLPWSPHCICLHSAIWLFVWLIVAVHLH